VQLEAGFVERDESDKSMEDVKLGRIELREVGALESDGI